jgi:hypothetical protein
MLNDFESTRKSKVTGDYLDMCNKCYSSVQEDLSVDSRSDLDESEVPDDEMVFDDDCVNYEEYDDED